MIIRRYANSLNIENVMLIDYALNATNLSHSEKLLL